MCFSSFSVHSDDRDFVVVLDDFGARGVLPVAFTVANAAALARLDLGFNKYVLWTAVALVLPSLCEHAAARAWCAVTSMCKRSSPVASRKQSRATPAMRRRQSRFDGGPFRAAAATATAHANKAAAPAAPALLAAASSGPATLASASRSPQQLKASTHTAQAAPLTALPAVSVSSATAAIRAAVLAARLCTDDLNARVGQVWNANF